MFHKKIVILDDMDVDKLLFQHKESSLVLVIPKKHSTYKSSFNTSFKEPYYG